MRAASILAILIILPLCSAFDLSPAHPGSGDKITLTGSATPGEHVSFRSSFSEPAGERRPVRVRDQPADPPETE